MSTDALLLVPLESATSYVLDADLRRSTGAHLSLPLATAFRDLEAELGVRLAGTPLIEGERLSAGGHRSLTAVALATHLEAAGLSWHVVDPGAWELRQWAGALQRLASLHPTCVGVSTTFTTSRPWLDALLHLVRRALPSAKIVLGGYFYTTSARDFLALDADVFVVGEGERRFPEVVRRLREGRRLEEVPGLYFRRNGRLESTGPAPALDLASLAAPDFGLASRIEPSLRPEAPAYSGVETQRGCGFMCAFCTYRTLAAPAALSVEQAAKRIGATPTRYVELFDATASAPRKRWNALLEQCQRLAPAKRIGAFARVSDLDAATVQCMRDAGVVHVFIGQESGDQRLLNLMRKGTKVEQFRPVIAALGQAGINVTLGMIHGFPGEDAISLAATRELLKQCNMDDPERPAVFSYLLYPFALQDFAAVASDAELSRESNHYFGYRSSAMGIERVCREVLRTVVEVSAVPHAPVSTLVLHRDLCLPTPLLSTSSARGAIFDWAKALERGVALFVARNEFGARLDRRALAELAPRVLRPFDASRSRAASLRCRVEGTLLRGLAREWRDETQATGPLTRALLWRSGAVTASRASGEATPIAPADPRAHAVQLLQGLNRRYRARAAKPAAQD